MSLMDLIDENSEIGIKAALSTYFIRFECEFRVFPGNAHRPEDIIWCQHEVFEKTGTKTVKEWEKHLEVWLRMEKILNG